MCITFIGNGGVREHVNGGVREHVQVVVNHI